MRRTEGSPKKGGFNQKQILRFFFLNFHKNYSSTLVYSLNGIAKWIRVQTNYPKIIAQTNFGPAAHPPSPPRRLTVSEIFLFGAKILKHDKTKTKMAIDHWGNIFLRKINVFRSQTNWIFLHFYLQCIKMDITKPNSLFNYVTKLDWKFWMVLF